MSTVNSSNAMGSSAPEVAVGSSAPRLLWGAVPRGCCGEQCPEVTMGSSAPRSIRPWQFFISCLL